MLVIYRQYSRDCDRGRAIIDEAEAIDSWKLGRGDRGKAEAARGYRLLEAEAEAEASYSSQKTM